MGYISVLTSLFSGLIYYKKTSTRLKFDVLSHFKILQSDNQLQSYLIRVLFTIIGKSKHFEIWRSWPRGGRR